MVEMEVAVEKNQGKLFGFSAFGSNDGDDDMYSSSDGFRSNHIPAFDTSGPPLAHKLPQMLKVAVIGESTSGKTAICEAFCKQNFTPASKYTITCGVEIYGKCISSSNLLGRRGGGIEENNVKEIGKQEEKVNLILLDSAGKELYREYLPKYWDKLDSVILVIDLSSGNSLENGKWWMDFVQSNILSNQSKRIGVLIGNKTDLKDQRVISSEAANNFATQHNLEYFETSVRDNSGLEEPFHFLAQEFFDLKSNNTGSTSASGRFRGRK